MNLDSKIQYDDCRGEEWGGIEIEAVHTFCVANQSNESCGNFSTG